MSFKSFAITVIVVFFIALSTRADSVIQSINADKDTEGSSWVAGLADNVGWTFTASQNYDLSKVETKFGDDTIGGTNYARLVTVEIYTAPPGDGGTLLGSADFAPAESAYAGSAFLAPISLTSGVSYFVGFRNVGGLTANITGDPSRESLGTIRYSATGESPAYGHTLTIDDATTAPILKFYGDPSPATAVPLPTTAAASGVLLAALSMFRRSRRRA